MSQPKRQKLHHESDHAPSITVNGGTVNIFLGNYNPRSCLADLDVSQTQPTVSNLDPVCTGALATGPWQPDGVEEEQEEMPDAGNNRSEHGNIRLENGNNGL
ncbi:hypothetical protein PV11_01766 [Exophiala sideris]|uniref:Uncharacterized protein n=1 Tax=Exophiala sideris TaxID=1016849 RepID=A0A0D1YU54_9EURO|nr:hypothetical protein PV11_01766 [Exophiala sideris]